MWVWFLGTWCNGDHGGGAKLVGLDYLKGLSQFLWSYDSITKRMFFQTLKSISTSAAPLVNPDVQQQPWSQVAHPQTVNLSTWTPLSSCLLNSQVERSRKVLGDFWHLGHSPVHPQFLGVQVLGKGATGALTLSLIIQVYSKDCGGLSHIFWSLLRELTVRRESKNFSCNNLHLSLPPCSISLLHFQCS